MSTYKTEGIIIKRNNFLESSLILDIYTKDYGKIEAVARSARKAKGKLKGHLELFLWTELILARGKSIDTITSSLTIESFSNLRNNLKLSYGAYYILELVDKMTAEGNRDERIFCLLKKSLLFLDKLASDDKFLITEDVKGLSLRGDSRSNPVTTRAELNNGIAASFRAFEKRGTPRNDNYLILLFQINLLDLTGFSPELNKCVFCGKSIKLNKNYFSFSTGGVIGNECVAKDLNSVPANNNAIKLLRLFQFKGGNIKEYNKHLDKCFGIIGKLKADEKLVLNSIFLMNKFIEFNAERKIKGVDFLRSA